MTETNETVQDVLRDMRQWKGDYSVFADRIEQSLSAGASGGGDGYVHSVPDKCDRITWRGHYYHLTFHSRPEKIAPASPATGDGKEKLVPDWSRAYQRDGQTFVPMQPAATPQPEADVRDAARLDWLLDKCAVVKTDGEQWRVEYEWLPEGNEGPFAATKRAAIDAAIAAAMSLPAQGRE